MSSERFASLQRQQERRQNAPRCGTKEGSLVSLGETRRREVASRELTLCAQAVCTHARVAPGLHAGRLLTRLGERQSESLPSLRLQAHVQALHARFRRGKHAQKPHRPLAVVGQRGAEAWPRAGCLRASSRARPSGHRG
eukprot:6199266-Pleurochrysis_carterae.AAC.3